MRACARHLLRLRALAHWMNRRVRESFRERVRKGERPKVEPWVTLLPHSFSFSLSLSTLMVKPQVYDTYVHWHLATERSHNASKSNPFNRVQHYVAKRSPTARERGEEEKKKEKETRGNRLGSVHNPFHNGCS